MNALNATHDPQLKSWVDSANRPECDFPIQNLPYGVFQDEALPRPRVGVAIGDQILDLSVLEEVGLLAPAPGRRVFNLPALNPFMALGPAAWKAVRAALSALLRQDNPRLRDDQALRSRALVAMHKAQLLLPVEITGYTDFYSSREHATNVGALFRDPASALLPNWLELPVAYNGRASSVVISGTPVRRPLGQIKWPDAERPVFSASRRLDFELEAGFIIGQGNPLGQPVPVNVAESHIFGMVLVNDWSARDIQQWEYVPLGPFNAKGFATSISPWVVTMEALTPFRVKGPQQDPVPLPYLHQEGSGSYDISLEVHLQPADAPQPTIVSRTNFRYLYWSMAQQLAHHTISGCNTRTGDLMASGTISGPTPDRLGSLLEMTRGGRQPITLATGEQRTFLEDGDEVTLTGWCQGQGYRIGFGEVRGRILPALSLEVPE